MITFITLLAIER